MIGGKQYVVIASDISLHLESQTATWAVYIRGDFGTVKRSGAFLAYQAESWILELQAVCNGIWIASKYCDLSKHRLIIYSEVAHLFKFKYKKNYQGEITKEPFERHRRRFDFFEEHMKPALSLAESYEIRDIKAHTSPKKIKKMTTGHKRYFMNRWCDIECRRLMKELRKNGKLKK